MRFLAQAPILTVNNFTLNLGSGGNGGKAETKKDCDPGVAEGGQGGKAGYVGKNETALQYLAVWLAW